MVVYNRGGMQVARHKKKRLAPVGKVSASSAMPLVVEVLCADVQPSEKSPAFL